MLMFITAILIIGVYLALRYGTDSRDGRDWSWTDRPAAGPRDIVAGRC